jgi:hypothetical protein
LLSCLLAAFLCFCLLLFLFFLWQVHDGSWKAAAGVLNAFRTCPAPPHPACRRLHLPNHHHQDLQRHKPAGGHTGACGTVRYRSVPHCNVLYCGPLWCVVWRVAHVHPTSTLRDRSDEGAAPRCCLPPLGGLPMLPRCAVPLTLPPLSHVTSSPSHFTAACRRPPAPPCRRACTR